MLKTFFSAFVYFGILGLYLYYPDNSVAWFLNAVTNIFLILLFIICDGMLIYTNVNFDRFVLVESDKDKRNKFFERINTPKITGWGATFRIYSQQFFLLLCLGVFFKLNLPLNFTCFSLLLVLNIIAIIIRKKSLVLLKAREMTDNITK